MNRRWLIAASVISLTGLAGCAAASPANASKTTANETQAQGSPLVGRTAPDFVLTKIDGNDKVALKDLLGKQPIILNAWASWCGPCQHETPDLVNAAKANGGKIQFVGVNMTNQDSLSDAKDFIQKYRVAYPVLLDSNGTFFNKYGIIGLPTTFVINPEGKVIDAHVGGLSESQVNAFVQEALKSSST